MPYYFIVILTSLLFSLATPVLSQSRNLFPRPPEIEQDVHFWIRVYTEIDDNHGFIHDKEHLNVVYETLDLPSKSDQQAIKNRKQHYQEILLQLASGKRKNLTKEEQRVLALWPRGINNKDLQAAADKIRFQRGQSNRFREGLIRAGAYKPFIFKTLDSLNLPRELVAIPHVESSFNPAAYSHAGAAGLWQFTRPTGQKFLRVDHLVDERLDPFQATVGAAQLLKHNYEIVGTWPLAITAYNHGISGMIQAKERVGTSDIVAIRKRYKSPIFGFASRNYYVAFLAALEVDSKAKHYFGSLPLDPPQKNEVMELKSFVSINSLQRALKIDHATLKKHNPALLSAIWEGKKYVPQGYKLRIPCTPACRGTKTIAYLAPWEQFNKQVPDQFHQVQRGETLSGIANHYGIKIQELAEFNGLSNLQNIRVGQRLRLPLSIPQPIAKDYIVQRGDTLSSIAHRFGVALQALLKTNKITDKHQIYEGQRLQLAQSSSKE